MDSVWLFCNYFGLVCLRGISFHQLRDVSAFEPLNCLAKTWSQPLCCCFFSLPFPLCDGVYFVPFPSNCCISRIGLKSMLMHNYDASQGHKMLHVNNKRRRSHFKSVPGCTQLRVQRGAALAKCHSMGGNRGRAPAFCLRVVGTLKCAGQWTRLTLHRRPSCSL